MDSLKVCVNSEDIYKDFVRDAENRFDTSNYEAERSLPIGGNKKVIGVMTDKLEGVSL